MQRLLLCRAYQIRLVEHDAVGECDLCQGLGIFAQMLLDMAGIHQGDDAIQMEFLLDVIVNEEGLRHRSGICESGGLQHDAVEAVTPPRQVAQYADQVAAHRAADAAVVHLENFFVGVDHQILVDADLAELILDDCNAQAMTLAEDAVEQGGLAAAKEAGQHGYRTLFHHILSWVVSMGKGFKPQNGLHGEHPHERGCGLHRKAEARTGLAQQRHQIGRGNVDESAGREGEQSPQTQFHEL